MALGSLIGQWGGYGENLIAAAEFFIALWDCISYAALNRSDWQTSEEERRMAQIFLRSDSNWVRILVDAARAFIEAEGVDQQTARLLIKLGQRRGNLFFGTQAVSCFGLTDVRTLIGISKSEEARVGLLRDTAKTLSMKKSGVLIPAIIRYTRGPQSIFEYASTMSYRRSSKKRKHGQLSEGSQNFKCWISSNCIEVLAEFSRNMIINLNVSDFASRRAWIESLGDEVLDREEAKLYSIDYLSFDIGSPAVRYVCFLSDPAEAALFIPSSDLAYCHTKYSESIGKATDISQVTKVLRAKSIRLDKLISLLAGNCITDPMHEHSGPGRSQMSPLRAFSSAARVYKLLSNATISPNILSRPFGRAHWVPQGNTIDQNRPLEAFQGESLTRAQSFACIALLESAIHNIIHRPSNKW